MVLQMDKRSQILPLSLEQELVLSELFSVLLLVLDLGHGNVQEISEERQRTVMLRNELHLRRTEVRRQPMVFTLSIRLPLLERFS